MEIHHRWFLKIKNKFITIFNTKNVKSNYNFFIHLSFIKLLYSYKATVI